jgi:O-antigen/teichoic acid export membrane protein
MSTDAGKPRSARAALLLSAIARYGSFAISFVTIALVSRLLSPEEIGIFSISATLIALSQFMRLFGIHSFIIREKEIDRTKLRVCFTLSFAISVALAAVLFLAADLVARFYDAAVLADVLRLHCAAFLLGPLSMVARSMFEREMRFGALLGVELIDSLVQAATVLSLIALGYSFFGLVWGKIAGAASLWICYLYLAPQFAILPPLIRRVPGIISLGATLTLSSVIARLGQSFPELIIGRVLGLSDVAQFSRAGALLTAYRRTVIGVVRPITLPLLARARHAKPEEVNAIYLKYVGLFTGVSMPFLAFCAVMADTLILLVFGEQWLPAIPLARLLCFAVLMASIAHLSASFFVTIGQAGRLLQREFVFQGLYVSSIALTVYSGLTAMGFGILAAYLIGTLWTLYLVKLATGIAIVESLSTISKSALVAGGTAVGPLCFSLVEAPDTTSLLLKLSGACLTGALGWLIVLRLVKHGLWFEVVRALRVVWELPGTLRRNKGF